MKRIHATQHLMHLFCHMVDADLEGFRNQSRNVYFQNGVLYSYGPHYPMARKVSFGVGAGYREIVLINSKKSSVTTEKHKGYILSSTKPEQRTFEVPDIMNPEAPANIHHLQDLIADAASGIIRGLSDENIFFLAKAIDRHNDYAKAFGFKRFKLCPDFAQILKELDDENQARNETLAYNRRLRAHKKLETDRERYASEVPLWYRCENTVSIPDWAFGLDYDPVRVNGPRIETPRGAQVRLTEAKLLARAVKRGDVRPGDKVGPFTVDKVTGEFLHIGCHKINIKQALDAIKAGDREFLHNEGG